MRLSKAKLFSLILIMMAFIYMPTMRTQAVVTDNSFETFEDLQELCNREYESSTTYYYNGTDEFLFSSYIIIPENLTLSFTNADVSIVDYSNVTNNGSLDITGKFTINGTLINYGHVTTHNNPVDIIINFINYGNIDCFNAINIYGSLDNSGKLYLHDDLTTGVNGSINVLEQGYFNANKGTVYLLMNDTSKDISDFIDINNIKDILVQPYLNEAGVWNYSLTYLNSYFKLSDPTDLVWGTRYSSEWVYNPETDNSEVMLKEASIPGAISWKHEGSNAEMSKITVHKVEDSNFEHTMTITHDDSYTFNSFSSDVFLLNNFESGTYYFTVQYIGQDNRSKSNVVQSDFFTYVNPNQKLDGFTNLRWENIYDGMAGYATWNKGAGNVGDKEEYGFELQLAYSPELNGEYSMIMWYMNVGIDSDAISLSYDMVRQYGLGYYKFKARPVSKNITTATSAEWSEWSEPFEVLSLDDTIYPQDMEVNHYSMEFNAIGQTEQLYVEVYPENATDRSVTFTSGDTSVVQVTNDGLVTAVGAGNTYITVKTAIGNVSENIEVIVNIREQLPNPTDLRWDITYDWITEYDPVTGNMVVVGADEIEEPGTISFRLVPFNNVAYEISVYNVKDEFNPVYFDTFVQDSIEFYKYVNFALDWTNIEEGTYFYTVKYKSFRDDYADSDVIRSGNYVYTKSNEDVTYINPYDLQWDRRYQTIGKPDPDTGEFIWTREPQHFPGVISWKYDGDTSNIYQLNIYKVGSDTPVKSYGSTNSMGFSETDCDVLLRDEIESGTYYYTVQYVDNNWNPISELIQSDYYEYVNPGISINKPIDIRWENRNDGQPGYAVWGTDDNYENIELLGGHILEFYYSPTEFGEYHCVCTSNSLGHIEDSVFLDKSIVTNAGYGYYKFRVKLVSNDIQSANCSEWSDWSEVLNIQEIDNRVYPSGLNLNRDSLLFNSIEDSSFQLVATVYPEDAFDKSVIWTSSDESVVTVSDSGLVSVVGYGNAIITAKTVYGNNTAQCTVKVNEQQDTPELSKVCWGVEYRPQIIYDSEKDTNIIESVEEVYRPGVMSYILEPIDNSMVYLTLYNSDMNSQVYSIQGNISDNVYWIYNTDYPDWSELDSGSYYFVVKYDIGNDGIIEHEAYSNIFEYVKPDIKIAPFRNIRWENLGHDTIASAVWDMPEDYEFLDGYFVKIYGSDTIDGEYNYISSEYVNGMEYSADNLYFDLPNWVFDYTDNKYFKVSIKAASFDVTLRCNADEIITEPFYYDKNEVVEPDDEEPLINNPSALKWHVVYDKVTEYNPETDKWEVVSATEKESLGNFSFLGSAEPGNKYVVKLYNTKYNNSIFTWELDSDDIQSEYYECWVNWLYNENGTYYFTVQTVESNGLEVEGEIVRSEDFEFTRPTESVPAFSNVKWGSTNGGNMPTATWTFPDDLTYLDGYMVQLLYSSVKDGDYYEVDCATRNIDAFLTDYALSELIINNSGAGFYKLGIMSLSNNPILYNQSEFVYSEPIEIVEINGKLCVRPVSIVSNPATQEVEENATAVFTVAADGYNYTYQWQYKYVGAKEWINSSTEGYNTNSISVKATKARDGYQYRCVITDAFGNIAYSDAAKLNVKSSLAITGHPTSKTVNVGTDVTYAVIAQGTGLKYQWQYLLPNTSEWKNSGMNGANTSSITLQAISTRNGYKYRCVVTDASGNKVISNPASLTVKMDSINITKQPESATVNAGDDATFFVYASGNMLSFQWQYKLANSSEWKNSGMEGSKTNSITVNGITSRNGYQYRCVVTDANGNKVVSEAATLKVVVNGINITKQPENATVNVGDKATFSLHASGNMLSFQWQYKLANSSEWKNSGMTGSNTNSIVVEGTVARNGYQYRCVVTDANGNKVISDPANFTVKAGTVFAITSQPASKEVELNKNATFEVKATGNGLTYQWQYRTSSLGGWKVSGMAGAQTASITVQGTTARNGYQYRCVVKDANGKQLVSNAATLTVSVSSSNTFLIVTQPSDHTVQEGSNVTFAVVATGEGLKYQWQYKLPGSNEWKVSSMNGAKTSSITVQATAARNGYQYRCVVFDASGARIDSNAATLKVSAATSTKLAITSQPESKTVALNENATYTVVAEGEGLTYQWQYRTSSTAEWKKSGMTGSNTNSITVQGTAARNGYQYRCVVIDASGKQVVSNAADLIVTSEPAQLEYYFTQNGQKISSVTIEAGSQATVDVYVNQEGIKFNFSQTAVAGINLRTGNNTVTVKVAADMPEGQYFLVATRPDSAYGTIMLPLIVTAPSV